ncbi:MAG TPA: hypothetical protein VNW15_05505 [Rhizomicrobium sp.]|jgi:hypothetical protein|nr:hypothetical protein [Rhizomicrobium sp.]
MSSLISDPDDVHGRGFNANSFSFQHSFANHPLFSLDSIRELAGRLPKRPGFVHWQNGPVGVDALWTTNIGPRLSLDDTLAGIAENNSLVVLKHVEQDPVVGPILQALLNEVWDRMPAKVRPDITLGESLIFVNSPRRKTVYHIDLEASHLLQVSGLKTLYVFDGKGRPLVSDAVLEQHCAGNQSSAVYDPSRQHEATRHDMVPGYGAHIPSRAPHWVQNGDEVSVSININFDFHSVHHRMRPIYALNHKLRRLGINPAAPGRHPVIDDMKVAVYGAAKWLRSATSKRDAAYPNWTPPRR